MARVDSPYIKTVPLIAHLHGIEISEPERKMFKQIAMPFGFILFRRNVKDATQLKTLIRSIKELTQREDTPILIDQEGGRVQRLKAENGFQDYDAMANLGFLYDINQEKGLRASYLQGYLTGCQLESLGINVNCAPVCDVPVKGAHDVIGDRAFHHDRRAVAKLALNFANGLIDAGVLPVPKHIPGHGRALADSHQELPRVDVSFEKIIEDAYPFIELKDSPLAMTAHLIYQEIDARNPGTYSKKVINIIRETIGFKGILITDAIEMKALTGDMHQRASAVLKAGCDLVLFCNGDDDQMAKILEKLPTISHDLKEKWHNATAQIRQKERINSLQLKIEYEALMAELHDRDTQPLSDSDPVLDPTSQLESS